MSVSFPTERSEERESSKKPPEPKALIRFNSTRFAPSLAHMGRTYWVYILASQRNGTLYVGVTRDLARRAFEHRTGEGGIFTRRYGVKHLV